MGDIEGGNQGLSDNNVKLSEERAYLLELYKAALSDDWERAESIYKKSEMGYNVRITSRGETTLHIAALAGYDDFVEQLVQKMSKDDLLIRMKKIGTEESNRTENGNTAMHCAALSGNVEVAKAIMKKNPDVAMARGNGDFLPIYMAALRGKRAMVHYLYEATKCYFEDDSCTYLDKDRKDLLVTLICSEIYDVAWQMAKALLSRGTAPGSLEEQALQALAQKRINPPQLRQIFNCPFSGGNKVNKNINYNSAINLVQLLWDKLASDEEKLMELIKNKDGNLIIEAAKEGNVEFLRVVVGSYPDALFCYDDNKFTIFHYAILNREEEMWKWIHIGSVKTLVTTLKDSKNSNMLHLAARLAPPNQLETVPGDALQVQREIMWFEEVKSVMEPKDFHHKIEQEEENGEIREYTPMDIFMKEHKALMESGETWMRDTANSCMIVAALITTVAFAAAFTIPGGINGDDGTPIYLHQTLFKVFAISDSISLIFSAISLLDFLAILTSRYTFDDFLWSLPNKLLLGLLSLFISVLAMMVAFVITFFIVFKNGLLQFAIPIAPIASLPIILFIWQHFRLLFDVIRSTYTSFFHFDSDDSDDNPILHMRERKKRREFLAFL